MTDTDINLPPIRSTYLIAQQRSLLVMGVAGSGKSTVAAALADELGVRWIDGDDFHSAASRTKMSAGIPLTDEDRLPWLARLDAEMSAAEQAGESIIVACSALKQIYRQRLAVPAERRDLLYLHVSRQELERRLQSRKGHFAGPALLESQLATLEAPAPEYWLDGEAPLTTIVARAAARWQPSK